MKKFLLLSVFFLSFLMPKAQNRCSRPIANSLFQQRKQQISAMGNELRKLQEAVRFSQDNCLSSEQIRELMSLFREEYNRLALAENAYAYVFDPENYYEVYDGFTKFSSVVRLYDFINKGGTPINIYPNNPSNPNNPTNPNYPDFTGYPLYNYPDYQNYFGAKNCSAPISESVFQSIAARIRAVPNENTRTNVARQAVQTNCLAVSQLMRLVSLLSNENNRLEVMRLSYPNIYDVDNLLTASQVFQNRINYQQWEAFLQQNQQGNPVNTLPGTACVVSNNDYANIVQSIRRENISDNRMRVAKNITRNYNCFSVEQVRGIVKLFNFDEQRLEIAKYLYDYTALQERRQYFMVANELTFNSNREELTEFINERGGR
ncbi:MAG: DUF4476 domain-containing protein [Raineya sp.]|nr:DUF4476 domain-containing protein [Raineya sp.]